MTQPTQGQTASWRDRWDQIPGPQGFPTQANSYWTNKEKPIYLPQPDLKSSPPGCNDRSGGLKRGCGSRKEYILVKQKDWQSSDCLGHEQERITGLEDCKP